MISVSIFFYWRTICNLMISLQTFLTKFNTSTKTAGLPVIAEPTVLRNPVMQSKWSKLHADKYCKGDIILHIDSKEVVGCHTSIKNH